MPRVAELIHEVLSEKLGRPAILRKVKNRGDSFITDPVFSYIQTADRNRRRDYRLGFQWEPQYRCLWFYMVHNPIGAETFKQNLDVTDLFEVIRKTASFRSAHKLLFSSKEAYRSTGNETMEFWSESVNKFQRELRAFDEAHDLKRDLFPKLPNRGKKRTTDRAWAAGNQFGLLLATGGDNTFDKSTIKKIIDRSWPLFMALYPTQPIFKRDATLARQLKVKDPNKRCNVDHIKRLPKRIKGAKCSGIIDAAHIKPHRLGGSDKSENGIWLCRHHHQLTEGTLKGTWPKPEFTK